MSIESFNNDVQVGFEDALDRGDDRAEEGVELIVVFTTPASGPSLPLFPENGLVLGLPLVPLDRPEPVPVSVPYTADVETAGTTLSFQTNAPTAGAAVEDIIQQYVDVIASLGTLAGADIKHEVIDNGDGSFSVKVLDQNSAFPTWPVAEFTVSNVQSDSWPALEGLDAGPESRVEFSFDGTSYTASYDGFTDEEIEALSNVDWDEAFSTDTFFDPNGDIVILDNVSLFLWLGGDAELTNKVLDIEFSDGNSTFTFRSFIEGENPPPFSDAAGAGRFAQYLITADASTTGRQLREVDGKIEGDVDVEVLDDLLAEIDYENVREVLSVTDGNIPEWSDLETTAYALGSYGLGDLVNTPEWAAFVEANFDESGALLPGLGIEEVDVSAFETSFSPEHWDDASSALHSITSEALVLSDNLEDLATRFDAVAEGEELPFDSALFDDISSSNEHAQGRRQLIFLTPAGISSLTSLLLNQGGSLASGAASISSSYMVSAGTSSGGLGITAALEGVKTASEGVTAALGGVTAAGATVFTALAAIGTLHVYAGLKAWDLLKNGPNVISIGGVKNTADIATELATRLKTPTQNADLEPVGLSPLEQDMADRLTAELKMLLNDDGAPSDPDAAVALADTWYKDGAPRAVIETALAGLTEGERMSMSEAAIDGTDDATNYWTYLSETPDAEFSITTEIFFNSDRTRDGVFNGLVKSFGTVNATAEFTPFQNLSIKIADALENADEGLVAAVFGSWPGSFDTMSPTYLNGSGALLNNTLNVMSYGSDALLSDYPAQLPDTAKEIHGVSEWARTDPHGFDALLITSADAAGFTGAFLLNALDSTQAFEHLYRINGALGSGPDLITRLKDPASSLNTVYDKLMPSTQDGLELNAQALELLTGTPEQAAQHLSTLSTDEAAKQVSALFDLKLEFGTNVALLIGEPENPFVFDDPTAFFAELFKYRGPKKLHLTLESMTTSYLKRKGESKLEFLDRPAWMETANEHLNGLGRDDTLDFLLQSSSSSEVVNYLTSLSEAELGDALDTLMSNGMDPNKVDEILQDLFDRSPYIMSQAVGEMDPAKAADLLKAMSPLDAYVLLADMDPAKAAAIMDQSSDSFVEDILSAYSSVDNTDHWNEVISKMINGIVRSPNTVPGTAAREELGDGHRLFNVADGTETFENDREVDEDGLDELQEDFDALSGDVFLFTVPERARLRTYFAPLFRERGRVWLTEPHSDDPASATFREPAEGAGHPSLSLVTLGLRKKTDPASFRAESYLDVRPLENGEPPADSPIVSATQLHNHLIAEAEASPASTGGTSTLHAAGKGKKSAFNVGYIRYTVDGNEQMFRVAGSSNNSASIPVTTAYRDGERPTISVGGEDYEFVVGGSDSNRPRDMAYDFMEAITKGVPTLINPQHVDVPFISRMRKFIEELMSDPNVVINEIVIHDVAPGSFGACRDCTTAFEEFAAEMYEKYQVNVVLFEEPPTKGIRGDYAEMPPPDA